MGELNDASVPLQVLSCTLHAWVSSVFQKKKSKCNTSVSPEGLSHYVMRLHPSATIHFFKEWKPVDDSRRDMIWLHPVELLKRWLLVVNVIGMICVHCYYSANWRKNNPRAYHYGSEKCDVQFNDTARVFTALGFENVYGCYVQMIVLQHKRRGSLETGTHKPSPSGT